MNVLICLLLGAGGADKSASSDFKDAAIGKLPAGWTATLTGKGKPSVWKVVEAADAPGGAKKGLAQTSESDGPLFNVCVADKSDFKDLDLTVSFKAVSGESDQGGGPVWRYKDNNNYYIARMNPLENNFRLYKVVGGVRKQLASSKAIAKAGEWHTIRVVHKGSKIQCYFDGKLQMEETDGEFPESGKIGLWTKADAQTVFADLRVTKP